MALTSTPDFNPRSPCGERLDDGQTEAQKAAISIHAPRAGSDLHRAGQRIPGAISIHAPRAGSDGKTRERLWRGEISIHAPRAGSDRRSSARTSATCCYFNPRSPCGERPYALGKVHGIRQISIHAPRAGSDMARRGHSRPDCDFNPRSPCGERRHTGRLAGRNIRISIHAPRAGSDPGRTNLFQSLAGFQSTLPVRGATCRAANEFKTLEFQSTLPVRGATVALLAYCRRFAISIHAPRAGSDFLSFPCLALPCGFQSTLPVRGATARTW